MYEQLRHRPDSYRINGVAVRHFKPYPDRACQNLPPIVASHGGNHQGKAFDLYADELAEHGFNVHVLDWYNHGNSHHLPADQFIKRGIKEVARNEIKSVVSALGEDPILIGHSMGGLASLTYAAENWVDQLVLIAPTPDVHVTAPIIPVPVDWDAPFPVPSFEQAKQMFWQGLTDEQARPLYEDLGPESPRAVWEATRYTLFVDLDAVKCPVFGVAAELDTLYPPNTTEQLTNLLSAHFITVPNVGHSDILMKPRAWQVGARRIAEWLKSDCSTGAEQSVR